MKHVTQHRARGFTLVEVLAVLGIILLITVIITLSLRTVTGNYTARGAALQVVSILDDARAHTLASQNNTVYGVHIASTSVTRFVGATYQANSTSNVVTTMPSRTAILGGTLSIGSNIVFTRITGTSTAGTLVVRRDGDPTTDTTITIYGTGVAEITE